MMIQRILGVPQQYLFCRLRCTTTRSTLKLGTLNFKVVGVVVGLLILSLCVSVSVDAAERNSAAPQSAAQEAAYSWLKLLDQHKFPRAWETSDPYFQSLMPQQDWEIQIETLYLPMGKVMSRVLRFQEHMTSVGGGSKGDFYLLVFDSAFAYKKKVEESLTVKKGPDGRWRVAGYTVK